MTNLINWDNGNQYTQTAEEIFTNVYSQQIDLSSTKGVYKTFILPYDNIIEYKISLNVRCVDKLENIIISVTNTDSWDSSIYKIFTKYDGLSTTTYKQVSWTFTPPPRISTSATKQITIYIGAHINPNILPQESVIIKYFNFQITPINGNIISNGSIFSNNGLNIEGIANLRNQTNIYGTTYLYNNAVMYSSLNISGPVIINNQTCFKPEIVIEAQRYLGLIP
jgi:hypothetical protein